MQSGGSYFFKYLQAQQKIKAEEDKSGLKIEKQPVNDVSKEISEKELIQLAKNRKPGIFYISTAEDKLEFDTENPLLYYALGCHGEGNIDQDEVAKALNDWIAVDPKNRKPKIIFLLGDNIYSNGARSLNDPGFQKCFEEMYRKYEHLKDVKFIVIPGNHDEAIHALRPPLFKYGLEVLANEIAYTFLKKQPDQFIKEVADKELGKINIIPIDQMPHWTMLSAGGDVFVMGNVQFFCGNSNTFAGDVYEYLKNKVDNQVTNLMLANELATIFNRTLISHMHHPGVSPDKRSYNDDLSMYYPDENYRQKMLEFFGLPLKGKYSNNDLVDAALQKLNIEIHMSNNAHHHGIFYYNDSSAPQPQQKISNENKSEIIETKEVKKRYYRKIFCLGGGGGGLQNRLEFGSQEFMGGYWRKFGFGEFFVDQKIPGKIKAYIHTHDKGLKNTQIHHFRSDQLEALNLETNSTQKKPFNKEELIRIQKLHRITKTAIKNYFNFLHEHQKRDPESENPGGKFFSLHPFFGNVSHGHKGVNNAHKIWNYITKMEIESFVETLNYIYHILIERKTEATDNSLIKFLNKELVKTSVDSNDSNKEEVIDEKTLPKEDGFEMELTDLWTKHCNTPRSVPNKQKIV